MNYDLYIIPLKPDNLFNLLSLETSLLTEDRRQVLEYLENNQEEPTSHFGYDQFK